jgi:alkylation response protein AidB-like acyl-CoA dehydrogenase
MDKPRSTETPLAAARRLAPQVASHAEQIERERRLPEALVTALCEAGLFRMLLPASARGLEVAPRISAEAIETIAGADASTGWCLSQANGCATIASYLETATAREVFGERRAILAWGPPSEGRAVAVPGGYRVSGKWSFASGCRHATWLGPSCNVVEADGTPRRLPDGQTDFRTFLLPATAATFEDIWHVSGLCGTASDAFVVHDLFVPEALAPRQVVAERRETGPLYRFPLWCFYSSGFASVALGTARAMLDAFIALARDKTPRQLRNTLRENAVVQSQVARAEVEWHAARTFLHAMLDAAWEEAQRGALPPARLALLRVAGTDAIHRAAHVADNVYQLAGATAVFESSPYARRFRDIHAIMQQIQARQAHYESAGRVFLGLDPDATGFQS